ncbi:hypothetical protein J2794_005972 [Paraburkholderia terricola]|uniref:hypothetical protein n=1 Tax=Paraburkholderia terricola TaxID=169427 RepID=UPI002866A687|nr:hypothetical protein [Paraburkholderia terricola]MDR6449834.1 hypothetical protein [Paraburkholderia terricola]
MSYVNSLLRVIGERAPVDPHDIEVDVNNHPVHPFRSVADAEQTASTFLRACQFYSLKYIEPGGAPGEVGLQRVHSLVALLFGYSQWPDLVRDIRQKLHASYFDENGSPEALHRKFADRLAPRLVHLDAGRIYWALRTSGFGCGPERRKLGHQIMDLYQCETFEQWHKLET